MRRQATFVIVASLASGVAASKLLLMLGLTNVAIRYPLAAALGYVVFAVLASIWITRCRREANQTREEKPKARTEWLDWLDFLDEAALVALAGWIA
jgi:hypothetical protein